MLKGGVLQKPELTNSINTRTNFVKFLENSNVTMWSNKSSYGIILLCELVNDNFTSPYYSFRSYNFGQEIRKIIFKLVPLVDKFQKRPILMIGSREKKRTIFSDFINEYQVQLHIALSSSTYLESLCPYPIYLDTFSLIKEYDDDFDDIYTISDSTVISSDINSSKGSILFDDYEFLNLLESKYVSNVSNENDDDIDDTIIEDDYFKGGNSTNIITVLKDKLLNNQFESIGIMAMEFGEGFNTLFSFKDNSKYKLYKNMARFAIIELFIFSGIMHNDIHQENILFNPHYTGYFYNLSGKALTIDFGLVQTINFEQYTKSRKYYDDSNFLNLVNYIYTVSIVNNNVENDRYSWFNEIDDIDVRTLANLKTIRNVSIDQITTYSLKMNKNITITYENIFSVYPLLPLNLYKYLKYFPRKENKILITKGGSKDYDIYMSKDMKFSTLFMKILITIANSLINLTNYEKIINVKKNKKIYNNIESGYSKLVPIKAGKKTNQKNKKSKKIKKKSKKSITYRNKIAL